MNGTRSGRKLFALVAAVGVLFAAVGPVAAVGASVAGNAAGNAALSIGVSRGAARVTVTVTNATTGAGVAGANVTVSPSSYRGSGDYVTDEDGVVVLPAPNETVTVTIEAEKDNLTGSTTVRLRATNGTGPPPSRSDSGSPPGSTA